MKMFDDWAFLMEAQAIYNDSSKEEIYIIDYFSGQAGLASMSPIPEPLTLLTVALVGMLASLAALAGALRVPVLPALKSE